MGLEGSFWVSNHGLNFRTFTNHISATMTLRITMNNEYIIHKSGLYFICFPNSYSIFQSIHGSDAVESILCFHGTIIRKWLQDINLKLHVAFTLAMICFLVSSWKCRRVGHLAEDCTVKTSSLPIGEYA